MYGVSMFSLDGAELVNGLSDDVQNAAQGGRADRDSDRTIGVYRLHPADQPFSGFHCDATATTFPQMLLDFDRDSDWLRNIEAVADNPQSLINGRELNLFELYVYNRPNNLQHLSLFRHS